ncbi:cation:proton antiporter [Candidatus Woesearchaeota archaeon]|nr:cation:proton antiporter [Candidatus Woesearchaeota archaeon]
MTDVYLEIGILIIVAMMGAYVAKLSRQPLIPAYILSGIILGQGLGIITSTELISTLSEIGIAFLLFMVGLELNFRHAKDIGKVSFIVGSLQVLIVGFVGYGAMLLLGFGAKEAAYLGVMVTFSSTMIVIKLLSDAQQLSTLQGRLAIGVLIVQDILAIIALSVIEGSNLSSATSVSLFLLKGFTLLAAGILTSIFIFPQVFRFAAKSSELLLCLSLGICFIFSLLYRSIGFSVAIGAFVAGVLLANLPYNVEIIGRVKALRDFFVIIFFTSLGLQLKVQSISHLVWPMLLLGLIVVVFKPLFTFLLFAWLGYTDRTAFLSSITLGQISEFSLIILGAGMAQGILSQDVFFAVTLLGIATMTLTSYLVKYEHIITKLYHSLCGRLQVNVQHVSAQKRLSSEVILCGYDRIGYSILKALQAQKRKLFVIDHNPDVISHLHARGVPCMYGNFGSPDFLEMLDLDQTKLIISTSPSFSDNAALLRKVRSINKNVPVFVTAYQINEALAHYKCGASYVILPHVLGGNIVASILHQFSRDPTHLSTTRTRHIHELLERWRLYKGDDASDINASWNV